MRSRLGAPNAKPAGDFGSTAGSREEGAVYRNA